MSLENCNKLNFEILVLDCLPGTNTSKTRKILSI